MPTTEPSLGTFGLVDDPSKDIPVIDQPGIPFTIVGYRRVKATSGKWKGKHEPVEFEFHLRPGDNFGAVFRAVVSADGGGAIAIATACRFIRDGLIGEDRERFAEVLAHPDIEFSDDMLAEVTIAMAERYGLRPSTPRSDNAGGSRPGGSTSVPGSGRPRSTSTRRAPR